MWRRKTRGCVSLGIPTVAWHRSFDFPPKTPLWNLSPTSCTNSAAAASAPSHHTSIRAVCLCVCVFWEVGCLGQSSVNPPGCKRYSASATVSFMSLCLSVSVFFISGEEGRKKMKRWTLFELMSQRCVDCVHKLASCTCRIYGILCWGVSVIFMVSF